MLGSVAIVCERHEDVVGFQEVLVVLVESPRLVLLVLLSLLQCPPLPFVCLEACAAQIVTWQAQSQPQKRKEFSKAF